MIHLLREKAKNDYNKSRPEVFRYIIVFGLPKALKDFKAQPGLIHRFNYVHTTNLMPLINII